MSPSVAAPSLISSLIRKSADTTLIRHSYPRRGTRIDRNAAGIFYIYPYSLWKQETIKTCYRQKREGFSIPSKRVNLSPIGKMGYPLDASDV
jgi:hypothetical protein